MAADDKVIAVSSAGSELKYLGFVRVVFLQAIAWALNLYGAAKAWLVALQTVVILVEAAVTVVVVRVYTKLKSLPDETLQFLDNKIDALARVYDKCSPSLVKKVVGAALNATTQPAIVAMQVAGVNGPRAAMRYIVGEIYQDIQSLLTKFRHFLLALLMKIGRYLMSKLTATLLEVMEAQTVRKALVPLTPTVIDLLGKCNEGITCVFGVITSAMYITSAALGWVPVIGGATKAAAGVASAAQATLTSAVEKIVLTLTGIQLVAQTAATAADADSRLKGLSLSVVSVSIFALLHI